ncbi:MAG: hypothetical protein HZC41_00155 [Chloroflexi bacterium]|nr:hypothetical protein [Chloroflexota bacterium]
MNNTLHQTISYELKDIVSRHLTEIRQYVPAPGSPNVGTPDDILCHLKRLSEICWRSNSRNVSPERLQEVQDAINSVESFLRVMNQDLDASFEQTGIGQILVQAQAWCQAALPVLAGLSLQGVWDFIAPVKPDHLRQLAPGVFEAQWWKPVPWMDVEILRRTEGVTIHQEETDPKHLPGGMAVRFSVTTG